MIVPSTAQGKLGLDVVTSRLAELTLSDAAAVRVQSWDSLSDVEGVRAELSRVSELQECLEFDDPMPLRAFPSIYDALDRARPEGAALDFEELSNIRRVAVMARLVGSFFGRRSTKFPAVSSSLKRLRPAEELEDAINEALDDQGTLKDSASSELRRIRQELANARSSVRQNVTRALGSASKNGYAAEEQPTIRGGRMVIPIRAEAKRKIKGFVHDVSSSGQTVYIEPAAALEMNNRVRELELEERREIERIRRRLTDFVRSVRTDLSVNCDLLLQLDVRRAKARLANELDAESPEVGTEGIIRFSEGRNPALILHFERSNSEREVVPLDFEIGSEAMTVVISGPNAGGKSVAMKAVGLMAELISRGMPIPVAPGSRFDFFTPIFVDIGDEQSLTDDLSTFTSHMRNLARVLTESDDRSLVLIDEAGTGTDPDAGSAVAQAALEMLTKRGVRTIVTTHFGSLKVFAHQTEGVENASMEFDRENLEPTYRYLYGVPGSSYASEIADRVGIPGDITNRARQLIQSEQLHAEDLIQSLEQKNAELDRELTALRKEKKTVAHNRRELQQRIDKLKSEKEQIREDALREADRILKDANRAVERTIREIREAEAAKEQTTKARERLDRERKDIERSAGQIDREKEKRRRKKPDQRRETSSSDKDETILEGDRVRIDDQKTVGEVTSIDDREAVVAFGSMQLRTSPDRLTRVGSAPEQKVTVREFQQGERLSAQDVKRRIDLRGLRVTEAIAEVTGFLDRAVAAGLNRVEILHGKGSGALRNAVQEYLATYAGVTDFEDAPWDEGGPGVTLVRLDA